MSEAEKIERLTKMQAQLLDIIHNARIANGILMAEAFGLREVSDRQVEATRFAVNTMSERMFEVSQLLK